MKFVAIIVVMLVYTAAAAESNEFIKTNGTSFTLGDKPLFVTGVNNHYLTFGTDAEVREVLDDAVALGANVIRTFLVPVIGSLDGHTPTIWKPFKVGGNSSDDLNVHGNYLLYWDDKTNKMAINDGVNGIQKIDTLIAEAKKRNLRLVIAFLDFWNFTGGMQQMVAWYNKDYLSLPKISGLSFARDNHFFFTDPRTIQDYQHWVAYVVNRINPKTGLHYRDDPTIMAWELANEANITPDKLRLQWTQTMAAFVKQHDHNHLVASGNASVDTENFDISLPAIDFGTWHGYPIYLRISVDQLDRRIRQYCAVAAKYQKPVLLEEFGYARSNPDQVAAYTKWLTTIAGDPDCAGWLVWKLVSRQTDGTYPIDRVEQFDVRKIDTALWNVIHETITRGRSYD